MIWLTLLSVISIILTTICIAFLIKIGKASSNNSTQELKSQLDMILRDISKVETSSKDEIARNREELNRSLRANREELSMALKAFQDVFSANVKDFNDLQRQKFDSLIITQQELNKTTELRLERIRETIETRLTHLQQDNMKKLEEMRNTVDEKLQQSVEKRFNESFKLISERLDLVHKGLGEMQTLASGVGDLKKVLTNVKTRGNLGEIQLGNILEQILSPEQYEINAVVKQGSAERVEFAVKLPGRNEDNKSLLLPIDSKFPVEDYQRLLEAYDRLTTSNSSIEIENLSKLFENAVKKNAKDIRDKYINPPTTTDFAIMFVPTEGLYAEILRRTGLFEALQRDYRVSVVGPSNLVAFLNSLQMGFRTLAIEKRSGEVWQLLGAIKTEFGKFGDILEKTKKKLQEASNVIDLAGARTRVIERKLRSVQELPADLSNQMLGENTDTETNDELDEK